MKSIMTKEQSERLEKVTKKLIDIGFELDGQHSTANINYKKIGLTIKALSDGAKLDFYHIQAKHAEQRILENDMRAKKLLK